MALILSRLGEMNIDGQNIRGAFLEGAPTDLRALADMYGEGVTVSLAAPTMADMQAMTDPITADPDALEAYMAANPLPDEWTVRDRFAAAALSGDMANTEEGAFANDVAPHYLEARARLFYRIADAMMEARK